jgi:hypothetical protein
MFLYAYYIYVGLFKNLLIKINNKNTAQITNGKHKSLLISYAHYICCLGVL